VGRTGSGKTTLLMALFRMFELSYGRCARGRAGKKKNRYVVERHVKEWVLAMLGIEAGVNPISIR